MDFRQRIQQLKALFSLTTPFRIEESRIEVRPFLFKLTHNSSIVHTIQKQFSGTGFCPISDDCVEENKQFHYTIFTPDKQKRYSRAILLLHGLNERSWDKYLPWAETLAVNTRLPVILFPIAFHMNRAPALWSNPRQIRPWVESRREESPGVADATFANVALSLRISRDPLRFSCSGIETIFNIEQLLYEIKDGRHPLFQEGAGIDIFSYSIGSLLSQVMLIANRTKLFDDTRLFMFCGGSLMQEMDGGSKDIMDSDSYRFMQKYYMEHFVDRSTSVETPETSPLANALRLLIREDRFAGRRETFFRSAVDRIRAVTLRRDTVIPTLGVAKAFGSSAAQMLQEIDFPYRYTHQIPFPIIGEASSQAVNHAFSSVFDRACSFLA